MNIDHFTLLSTLGDGINCACLLSARAVLDGRPLDDGHPSAVLRRLALVLDDGPWWDSDEERTQVLLPVAKDPRFSATACDASPAAEDERARLAARWSSGYAARKAAVAASNLMEAQQPNEAHDLRGRVQVLIATPPASLSSADLARAAAAVTRSARRYAAIYAGQKQPSRAKTGLRSEIGNTVEGAADAAYATGLAAVLAADTDPATRKDVRDSLLSLFGELLDVKALAS